MAEHYYSAKQTSRFELKKISVVLMGKKFEFFVSPGVFSKDKIDNGTYILIENAEVKEGSKLLDLGCGYGPVGIVFAKVKKCDVVCNIRCRAFENFYLTNLIYTTLDVRINMRKRIFLFCKQNK